MKVGILSMQRVPNYGSFLQAYALKTMLLECGADEVEFIDIEPGEQIIKKSFMSRSRNLFKRLSNGSLLHRGKEKEWGKANAIWFRQFNGLLGMGNELKPKGTWDLAVIGSDEVFNCCQMSSYGFTRQLYGEIDGAPKVVSYAGSFGHTTMDQLIKYHLIGQIQTAMKSMEAISVRDKNSFDIIKGIIGKEPYLHIDPVLAYGYSKEIEEIPVPDLKDYVLIYSYNGRINNKQEIREIIRFAHSKNKKLISLFCHYDWCDEEILPQSPFHALGIFKGADYVITDTFHGTIFSVITYKRFCSLIRPSNNSKLGFLLEHLALKERKVTKPSEISKILEYPISYAETEKVLSRERNNTMNYLKNAMQ